MKTATSRRCRVCHFKRFCICKKVSAKARAIRTARWKLERAAKLYKRYLALWTKGEEMSRGKTHLPAGPWHKAMNDSDAAFWKAQVAVKKALEAGATTRELLA